MESEKHNRTKQDRGISALIFFLSILLCAALIACVAIGIGYFRIQEVRTALAQNNGETIPTEEPAAAPEVTPVPALENDLPSATAKAEEPLPTVDPETLENLPQMELNVQSPDQMQLFASIPDVVEAAFQELK